MIPEYLLAKIEKSDVIYRCIGNEMKNGILACGFMRKETADRSQYHFSNEYYSCFVLLRGSGEYIAEDGTSYPLQAGSLVQRLPGVPHSTRVDPDGKWLEFFISIGKPFFDSFCSLSVLNREPVLKAELLLGDLERYQKILQSLKATPDSLLPLRIPEMEKEILRMYGYHAHRVNLQRDPIEAACDMLSQNLDEEISLEELARSLQIGYETFRKVFKKQTGVSPARYRTRKKMEQARILLEGGVPMKEIAGLVGYGDVALLGRLFDDGHQFLIGDAVVFRGFEDAGEQLLPLGKEKRHRGQHDHQNVEKRCGKFGDRLRRFFCNAFRGNFAEDQDHDSGYDRGNRRTGVAAEKLDKKHRGKGAESDVDDVVADENRGEQLVKVLQQL